MCTGSSSSSSSNLRSVGQAEAAARAGNMTLYRQLGGSQGDEYRLQQSSLGPTQDPLAKLGIFATQDNKQVGAQTQSNNQTAAFSPYTGYGTQSSSPTQPGYNPFMPKVG